MKTHEATVVTGNEGITWGADAESGAEAEFWYVVPENAKINLSNRINLLGQVNFILGNNCELTSSNGGIYVDGNNQSSLTIWGESPTSGSLKAIGDERNAGIGGGPGGSCGSITINGGTITAHGGSGAAGIGGGDRSNDYYVAETGNPITINGGVITAEGGAGGAGIGGGKGSVYGNSIQIAGGTVTAKGGDGGAGIGGGQNSILNSVITISEGTVTATGGSNAAGIGKGGSQSESTGTFTTTEDGNAVIYASSISDVSGEDNWSGVIFDESNESGEGKVEGKVYGNPTPKESFTVKKDYTLDIPQGSSLTIPEGVTMTVDPGAQVDVKEGAALTVQEGATLTLKSGSALNAQGTVNAEGTTVDDGATIVSPSKNQTSISPPTASAITENSVTLAPITTITAGSNTVSVAATTIQYGYTVSGGSISAVANWQSSPTFSGLASGTTYTFYAQFLGNAYYNGAKSTGANITTNRPAAVPGSPSAIQGQVTGVRNPIVSAMKPYASVNVSSNLLTWTVEANGGASNTPLSTVARNLIVPLLGALGRGGSRLATSAQASDLTLALPASSQSQEAFALQVLEHAVIVPGGVSGLTLSPEATLGDLAGRECSVIAKTNTGTLTYTFEFVGEPEPAQTVTVYRLYNPYLDGAHLLTANETEVNELVEKGWQNEGALFKEWEANTEESQPVYRLYNPNNGDHFFTESDYEASTLAEIGWTREGIAWYAPLTSDLPAYRLYNPYQTEFGGLGNHLWTVLQNEYDYLVSLGWESEDIGWYALPLE